MFDLKLTPDRGRVILDVLGDGGHEARIAKSIRRYLANPTDGNRLGALDAIAALADENKLAEIRQAVRV